MIVRHDQVIGRVEPDPADLGAAPQHRPGMAGIGAFEPLLAGRRDGADIAGDIGGGQAEPPETSDHDMREILADAVALIESLGQRRRHLGRLGIVGEVTPDPGHQIAGRFQNGAAGVEARPRIVDHGGHMRHEPARIEVMGRRIRLEAPGIERERRDILPVPRQPGMGWRRAVDLDPRPHLELELAMRLGDGDRGHVVAEEAEPVITLGRARRDQQFALQHALARPVARQQSQDAAGKGHRPAIAVGGDVAQFVNHAMLVIREPSGPLFCRK